MTENKDIEHPDLDLFGKMPLEQKVDLFTSLPISSQKLLIGCSAFASTADPEMAKTVSRLTDEEYEQANDYLLGTQYLSLEGGRLQVAAPMKEFINIDLKKVWEEQKKRENRF